MKKVFLAALMVVGGCSDAVDENSAAVSTVSDAPERQMIRIATFNVSMFRQTKGQLALDLANTDDPQMEAVSRIVQSVNPDVLLINEFDYDHEGRALELFQTNYLSEGETSIAAYPFAYVVPSNTGVPSGVDLDNSGEIISEPGSRGYGSDAFGFGNFEGQYGFAIVSRYPIDISSIRSFQKFLWKDMPGNALPGEWYSEASRDVMRLSSKNHVDVPITIGSETLHVLALHPTPPTFDGPEDRNGKRNHDEIRLIADYVSVDKGDYLTDDKGGVGGLSGNSKFVILGDLNADPNDGDSYNHAIRQLLEHPRINAIEPMSNGGRAASDVAGGENDEHSTLSSTDTADFKDSGDNAVGNLRLDYALPSKNIKVLGSGVYWPAEGESGYEFVGPGFPPVSSDHRLVWIDVKLSSAE